MSAASGDWSLSVFTLLAFVYDWVSLPWISCDWLSMSYAIRWSTSYLIGRLPDRIGWPMSVAAGDWPLSIFTLLAFV